MRHCIVCRQIFEDLSAENDENASAAAASFLLLPDGTGYDFDAAPPPPPPCRGPPAPSLRTKAGVAWQLSRVLGLPANVFRGAAASGHSGSGRAPVDDDDSEDRALSELLCSQCLILFGEAQDLEKQLKEALLKLRARVWIPAESPVTSAVDADDRAAAPHDWIGSRACDHFDDIDYLLHEGGSDDETDGAVFAEGVEMQKSGEEASKSSLPAVGSDSADCSRQLTVANRESGRPRENPYSGIPSRFTAKALRSVGIQRCDDEAADVVEEDESLSCSVCFSNFVRAKNISKHLTLHNGPRLRCPKCDRTFPSDEGYHVHLVQCAFNLEADFKDPSSDGERVSCPFCGKGVVGLQAYRGHLLRSHLGRMHSCKSCPKTFARRNELLRHVTAAHGGEKFPCADCGKTFSFRNDLARHQREVHGDAGSAFRCRTCGKKFKSQRLMNEHAAKFHEKSHLWRLCEECGERGFFGSGNDNHYRRCTVANAGAACECSTCGKTFETPAKLRSHEMACKTPKRFECRVCGKAFKFKCRLNAHAACHADERPTQASTVTPQLDRAPAGPPDVAEERRGADEAWCLPDPEHDHHQTLHLLSSLNLPHAETLGAAAMDLFDL